MSKIGLISSSETINSISSQDHKQRYKILQCLDWCGQRDSRYYHRTLPDKTSTQHRLSATSHRVS